MSGSAEDWARQQVRIKELESLHRGVAVAIEMCVSRMRHALEGGADPRETLEICAEELNSERRHLIEKIEMLREWADDRPAS